MDCKSAQTLIAGYLDQELDRVQSWRSKVISTNALPVLKFTKTIKSLGRSRCRLVLHARHADVDELAGDLADHVHAEQLAAGRVEDQLNHAVGVADDLPARVLAVLGLADDVRDVLPSGSPARSCPTCEISGIV